MVNDKRHRTASGALIASVLVCAGLWTLGLRPVSERALPSPAAQRSGAAVPRTPRCTVSGRVTAAGGDAVAAATVCAACANCELAFSPRVPCARAGADGTFELSGLAPGDYRIAASAPGFVPGESPLAALAVGERRDGVRIVLAPGGVRLAGVVRDALGGPVPHAQLRIIGPAPAALFTSVVTDADGAFSTFTPGGALTIAASADGYAQVIASAVAPSSGVEIVLLPASTIAGRVIENADGRPVAGVTVRAVLPDLAVAELAPAAITAEDGSFSLAALLPGPYRLEAVAAQLRSVQPQNVELDIAERRAGITLVVGPATRIAARVEIAPAGKPCTRGHVLLAPAQSPGEAPSDQAGDPAGEPVAAPAAGAYTATAWMDSAGRVAFEGVPFGDYALVASCTDHVPAGPPPRVELRDAEVRELVVPVVPAPALAIRVVDELGRPVSQTAIGVRRAGDETVLGAAPLGDGRFTTGALSPGEYRVFTFDHGTGPAADGAEAQLGVAVTVPDRPGTVEVTLELAASARIEVRVARSDGRPHDGLFVYANGAKDGQPYMATAAGDGVYLLTGLPAGDYEIAASDGYNPALQRHVALASAATASVKLQFERPARITGRVLDDSGSPVTNAWVAAAHARPGMPGPPRGAAEGWFGGKALTDDQGRFEIEGLAAGATYKLRVRASDRRFAAFPAMAADSDVTLTLEAQVAIEGSVADAQGGPPEQAIVTAVHLDTQVSVRVRAEPDGRFRLDGVQPGDVLVAVEDASGQMAQRRVQVPKREGLRAVQLTLAPRNAQAPQAATTPLGPPS